MKLLNFSIGQVQTIQIGSELIKTAHVKSPVAEPWVITDQGAQGDKRAVHPDKIYSFARTAYRFWAAWLKLDPSEWPDGFFGENLTFDVLDEDELKVGDIFDLGDEVQLIVAGPRNPCVKLAWRLQQPPTFQKIFAQSHHTGVYFDVLRTGTMRPGDIATRIHRDPQMPSVVEVAAFAAGRLTPPLEPLQRLLAFNNLSGTIRHILLAKLEPAQRAAAAAKGRWRGWREFKVEDIVEEAPTIRSFHLAPLDDKPLCQSRPGQFVTARIPTQDGANVTRSWSLSSFSHNMERYRLSVRQQSGVGSQWIHAASIGTPVMLRAPAGDFVLDLGSFRPLVLIAAGIGITPLLAMLRAHLARGTVAAPVYLIYGSRSPETVAFRSELDDLARTHPSLHITYVYSQSAAGERPATRITAELVKDILRDLHVMFGNERRIALPWFEHDAYICGPGDFCHEIKAGLVGLGANSDHIFFELFSAAPIETSDVESAEIAFARSGKSCTWHAEEDISLLELAEKEGLEMKSDCRAGACLTCKTGVLQGETTARLDDGSVLLCIGRPKSAVVVLDC